jgi:hypothetical protein
MLCTVLHRRLASLLLAWFLFIGTGAAAFVHNLEHDHQDAAAAQSDDRDAPATPIHDDNNCPIHAQLHLPMLAASAAPILVLIGLFVSLAIPFSHSLVSQRTPLRIACRGPPIRAFISTCAA